VGNISPFLLTHLRWSILTVLLLFIYRKRLLEIVQHFLGWWKYFVIGGIALGGFNMLFYTAAHHTTAINLGILQGSIPIVVIVGSFFLFKKKITVTQSIGIVIGLIGVLELASGGNLQRLIEVDLNIGDMYMLLGCAYHRLQSLSVGSQLYRATWRWHEDQPVNPNPRRWWQPRWRSR
jgi:drug/metabolite transporter (DMT)-like permease